MARPEGFEPPTSKIEAWHSIRLSYGRVKKWCRQRGSNPCFLLTKEVSYHWTMAAMNECSLDSPDVMKMVGTTGFEPVTYAMSTRRSTTELSPQRVSHATGLCRGCPSHQVLNGMKQVLHFVDQWKTAVDGVLKRNHPKRLIGGGLGLR